MHRHTVYLVATLVLTSTLPTTFAPAAMAEPSSSLLRAVDTVRTASHCPALQSDPLVQRAAQMARQGTSDYLSFRTAAVPFSDPMPALKTIGYTGRKALLLSGYGNSEADAIHGLMLEGRDAIPDCSYTQYGTSAEWDDGGVVLAAVVLAAP